jgi:peptide/nickel transport system substrate-binding protein
MGEAGYAQGFDVIVPDLSPAFPEAQAAMNDGLRDIGIRVQLDNAPIDEIIDDLLAGKYAISYFSLASFRPWDTVTIQLRKDSLWNPLGYADFTADTLIAQVQRAEGVAAATLFRQLNAYIVEQAWNAPWTQVANGYATSKDVMVEPFSFAPVPPIYAIKPAAA